MLESFIVSQFAPPFDAEVQIEARDVGDATAEELRAVPQNLLEQAYVPLQVAVYPFTLPFHRPLAVVLTYLGHLGTSRREVMEIFGKSGKPNAAQIAEETLGLSPEAAAIVNGQTFAGLPAPRRPLDVLRL